MRRALGYILSAILILLLAAGGWTWWLVHRALPQTEGSAPLAGLRNEVTVDRDAWGVPFIQANSLEDLLEAQGYVVAQDRLWQMDVLRRVAAGELSEIFGRRTLAIDRQFRTLGLRAAAERELMQGDPKLRAIVEAYAGGVNHFIETHQGRLPWEFTALGYKPRPWAPSDSLLVGAYMFDNLTHSWESELDRAKVTELVGPQRAKDLYAVDSAWDHYIVGESDMTTPTAGAPAKMRILATAIWGAAPAEVRSKQTNEETGEPDIRALLAEFGADIGEQFGSNNWAVNGEHTASGKPLLANDTHLQLTTPCIWYMVHLKAPGWNVAGFTLPGSPLVIIGHNERVAWGFTNNGADVQDLYIEKFSAQNPRQYMVNGKWREAEVRHEKIGVRGEKDVAMDVTVTRHGPIVRREGDQAYAVRWTALEPGGLGGSGYYSLLGGASNWEEFREVARHITGPAQNCVFADVDGNIAYIVAARIPVRKNGNGAMPVPGDTDDYEWNGYIPFDALPQALNPPGGIIATANAKVAGPGYKYFLTERWGGPSRVERIYELLHEGNNFKAEDFIGMQTDIVSLPDKFLAEQLNAASRSVVAKDPRTGELIARLKRWDGRATAESVETAFVQMTRRELMRRLLEPVMHGQWPLYSWWRENVFIEDTLRERPPRWLPPDIHTYDELLMSSADDAVKQLAARTDSAQISDWRWGALIQLQMLHPLGQWRWLRGWFGIGPVDQPGTSSTVKQTGVSFGPTERFVADLSDWDHSLMNLSTGESGQLGSAHYKDEFPVWFEGRRIEAPFSDAAEARARVSHLVLQPMGKSPPPH